MHRNSAAYCNQTDAQSTKILEHFRTATADQRPPLAKLHLVTALTASKRPLQVFVTLIAH